MARVHFVKKARKNYKSNGIKKGDPYYWWSLQTGPRSSIKYRSKMRPKPSQLTSSEFLSTFYGIQESISDNTFDNVDDLQSAVETVISDLESLRDDTQSKLDNMPEQLQSGDTGELLSQRCSSLDEIIDNLQSVDYELSEDEDEDGNTLENLKDDIVAHLECGIE